MYAFKGKKPYKSWLKDGVNGGPSSMDILIRWLSNQENYTRWKGEDYDRIPKKLLLEDILDEMRKVGIYHRVAKDIASKISTLQSNYRLTQKWKQIEGQRLREEGVSDHIIHVELVKRFPYWDMLDQVFRKQKSTTTTTAWPMSISNITHSSSEDEEEDRYSSSSSQHSTKKNIVANNQNSYYMMESVLQLAREKEASKMERSQEMLQFLREKRQDREQLLIEQELTKRVKAKADLVRNLMEAGFNKQDIAEQLRLL